MEIEMTKQFNYDDLPVIQTRQGKIRGYQSGGTYIFKGIVYARAKRFQKPEEPECWDGIKEATSYGYVSPMLQEDVPNGELMVPHRYWIQNENCQNLNIWTQSLDKTAMRPVLVWFHGGGFSMGSSIEQKAYNGENMSKYGDVVVVTVNHRLNILGYLDLSQYGEKYADSANAGQEDLIAALKWIKENIKEFGGNPQNVTIFGQSGDRHRVVDHQVDRRQRVHLRGIAAQAFHRLAHGGQIHHRRYAGKVLHQDAGRAISNLPVGMGLLQPTGKGANIFFSHRVTVLPAQQVLHQHLQRLGQSTEIAQLLLRQRQTVVMPGFRVNLQRILTGFS